jgi:membrane fusion protein (multidrug efflux system)
MLERVSGHLPLQRVFAGIAGFFVLAGLLLMMTAPDAEEIAAVGGNQVLREIRVAELKLSSVDARVEISGVLEPRRVVLLFAETSGPVTAIGAEDLDAVEADQVLVEIDPLLAEVSVENASAGVIRAQSELELAKSNLARRSSLADSNISSASALEDATNAQRVAGADLRVALAELKRAKDDLANKIIRAPVAGSLRRFDVEIGEFLQLGEQLGELLDGSTSRVTIGLSDLQIVVVRPGHAATIQVAAFGGEVFEGQVLRVGKASDPLTKKFPVQVEIPNSDGRLLPGMIATVRVDLDTATDRMLVPRNATIEEFGLHSVFVIEAGPGGEGFVANRRRIQVREVPFQPVNFEVLSGVIAGERIALSEVRQLRDGEPVIPVATATR